MEYNQYNQETEPLLNKNDYFLDINDVFEKEKKDKEKSKNQIIPRICSPSNFFEFLFFCCIDYDLTNKQYELYIRLKDNISILYNKDDIKHEKLLQDFFDNIKDLLPEDDKDEYQIINDSNNNMSSTINTEINDNNLIKKLSKKVGFQNDNPRTDFRAAGLYSLEFMNYFATYHKIELKKILKDKYFYFALTSINLSFYIRLILYLTNIQDFQATLKSNNLEIFSRRQIKHFAEHLEKENTNNDLLYLIISHCLCFVFKKYSNEFEDGKKEEKYLKINSIIRLALNCLGETLDNIRENQNLGDELKRRFDKILLHENRNIKLKIN